MHKIENKLINRKRLKANVLFQFVGIFFKLKNVFIINGRNNFLLRDSQSKDYSIETNNALLTTAQSKIEELENKVSNHYFQLAKYEETQELLLKDK